MPLLDNSQISNLTNLKQFIAIGVFYGKFPPALFLLENLVELDFNNSNMVNIDLTNLYQLKKLKHLNFFRTGIRDVPDDITDLTNLKELILPLSAHKNLLKKAPEFCQKLQYLYSHQPIEQKCLTGVITHVRKMKSTWEERAVLLNLLSKNHSKVASLATPRMILAATDIARQELLRLNALEYYQKEYGAEDLSALQETGATIAIAGKLGINKNDLKQKLKKIGVKTTTKVTPTTTFLLLGQSPKGAYEKALMHNIPIVTESILIKYLDQHLDLYLLESTEEVAYQADQIANLLLSKNDDNILLALTFFKEGGFPKELLTAVYIAHRHSENTTIHRACMRLIKQYGSLELINAAKQKNPIFSTQRSESSALSTLKRLAKNTTELDTVQIAEWGIKHFGRGKSYLLFLAKEEEEQVACLRTLCQFKRLNLSNCALKSLPKGLFELTELVALDLSYNHYIKHISDKIANLKNLEVLNIHRCLVAGNASRVQELRALLPNTKIIVA
jgi:Leucine-rich repeat (LRR) protein